MKISEIKGYICPTCGNSKPDAFDNVSRRYICLNRTGHTYGLAEEMENDGSN